MLMYKLYCAVAELHALTITDADMTNALRDFKPAALRSISLHKPAELGWADVGGLQAVRDSLMETLLLPSKVQCPSPLTLTLTLVILIM